MSGPWNLPISEVSGLGMRKNPYSGMPEVLGVGDEDLRIAVAMVNDDGDLTVVEPTKVKGMNRHEKSEWEGVAGDAGGRIFILREESSELLLIAPDFILERRIQLVHPWLGDKHYGLESLLLLRRGHFICAKQQTPVTFIEFGQDGESPIGVTSNSILSIDDEFEIPADSIGNLTALATWKMDEDSPLESVNDITVDGDGTMLAISSKSRCVGRLEHGLRPGHHAKVTWHRKLPGELFNASDAEAEGLLADSQLGYLVAVDSHGHAPNLFRLNGVFS